MKPYLILAVVLTVSLAGCRSARHDDSAYATQSFETRTLSCDGKRQTVTVWGKGRDTKEAMKQCRKNALRDIIFKGVTLGEQSCLRRPLVAEVNAEERHREFFDKFFSDKGKWNRYATLDKQQGDEKVLKNSGMENRRTTVVIDLDGLAEYLRKEGLTVINH